MFRRNLWILLAFPTLAVAADPPAPLGYVCGRAQAPIVIDGKLDDASWALAPWTADFVDIEGDVKPKPRFRTHAKMLWDDEYFYVAAELFEPHVWGTLTKHDSVIFHDNDFEVFIDPDGDNHAYYEIEINALNTEWDLFLGKPYRDGGPALNEWEIPGLKTATHVSGKLNDPEGADHSWTVEFAFPWKVLAEHAHRTTPPKDGDQWRINFSRVEWEHTIEGKTYKKVPNRPEANWVWSPQGAIDMHRPERWGYVQFSTEIPGKAAFQPDPQLPARDRLMAIYHAERKYHGQEKTWTDSLEALGLASLPPLANASTPTIKLVPTGFEASIELKATPGHPATTLTIRQDSRLTAQP